MFVLDKNELCVKNTRLRNNTLIKLALCTRARKKYGQDVDNNWTATQRPSY
jgi:hypothetical protein